MAIKRKANGQWASGNDSGTRFTSESLRGNQFAKGNPPNPKAFHKGTPMEQHPSWKGGVQITRSDGAYLAISPGVRARRAREAYRKFYGEIPNGYVIYHLDQDKLNDTPSNLEAISRAELIRRNRWD